MISFAFEGVSLDFSAGGSKKQKKLEGRSRALQTVLSSSADATGPWLVTEASPEADEGGGKDEEDATGRRELDVISPISSSTLRQ